MVGSCVVEEVGVWRSCVGGGVWLDIKESRKKTSKSLTH